MYLVFHSDLILSFQKDVLGVLLNGYLLSLYSFLVSVPLCYLILPSIFFGK